MRKISFRAKEIKTGKWVYGDLIHGVGDKEGRMYILPRNKIYPPGCRSLDGWEVDPETVGQFTGLIDKNGKEIYEGDILRIKIYHNEGQGETFDFREEFDVNDLKGPLWRYYISVVSFDDCAFCVSENSENDTGLGFLCGDMRHSFPIFEAEIIGNIHDSPELLNQ